MDKVKHIIIVLSGKGGVGKSTISTKISFSLADRGLKVGLLDVDLCGPSIPFMLGLQDHCVYQSEGGWIPIYDKEHNISVMSIAFLLRNPNDAVIWRGPKKNAMVRQFLNNVRWEELDFLIIDTPPGTSDEHLAVMESLKDISCSQAAIIVTTPQQISLDDVRKEVTFCNKVNLDVLGIIENMKGYVCPHCENPTNIFSSAGGEKLAAFTNVPFLGSFCFEAKIERPFQIKNICNLAVIHTIATRIITWNSNSS